MTSERICATKYNFTTKVYDLAEMRAKAAVKPKNCETFLFYCSLTAVIGEDV